MIDCARALGLDPLRLVGDPVDVLTGAMLDASLDVWLDGPAPFIWRRHYDSRQTSQNRGLGRGHTHSFDHHLHFGYDRSITYSGPTGIRVKFPVLDKDDGHAGALGHLLERVNSRWYRVHLPADVLGDGDVLEFELWHPAHPARLNSITHASKGRTLVYYSETGYISGFGDSAGHTIRVDWTTIPDAYGHPQPHIASLVLAGVADNEIEVSTSSSPTPSSKDFEQTRAWNPATAARRSDRTLITYRYDAGGRLIGATDSYRNNVSFDYDPKSRMVRRVDQRGYAFIFTYDGAGRCIRAAGEDGVDEVRLEYLPGVTIATLADGGQWLYEHPQGFLQRIIDPYGGQRRRELDDQAELALETDEAGRAFSIVRDLATAQAIGRQDSTGQLWPMGQVPCAPAHYVPTTAREWEFGRILPPGYGLPTRRALEMDWLPPAAIDELTPRPSSHPVDDALLERWRETTVRDHHGLPLRVERAGTAARRTWHYDQNGYWTRYTNFDGATWYRAFGSWNHLRELIDPLGSRTLLEHTPRERLARVTDPSGVVHGYVYDLRNLLAEIWRHGAMRERYLYDAGGELAEKSDARGRWLLRYERSNEGRHVVRTLASGERHELIYTAARQLQAATITAADGRADTFGFAYNLVGQRTLDQRNGRGVHRRFFAGRLDEIRVLEHFATSYRWHARTLTITDPTGAEHKIQRCDGGVIRKRLSNGSEEVVHYHPHGYCLQKLLTDKAGAVWKRAFDRTEEGNLRWIACSMRGYRSFKYDAADRIIAEHFPGVERVFAHNAGGDLVAAPGLGGVILDEHRLCAANQSRFEYDHRHHMAAAHTPSGTIHFRHNERDQLVEASGADIGMWTARYDVLGRRTETTHNGATTLFYWDSDRLVAEIAPDGRLRVYVYADELALAPFMFVDYAGIDVDPKSGARYFIAANHLGAPEVVFNDAGAVVWRAWLEAYGLARVEIGADFHMPLRWPGHYFDEATHLNYNRARYYSPNLGRYIESDPDGIRGGYNLHAYGRGNPLRYVDVRGLGCGEDETPHEPEQEATPPEQEQSAKPQTPPAPSPPAPPVSYERPSGFRAGVRDEVWNRAIEPSTGRVRDPLTGRFMGKNQPWHMGHLPGYEFRKHKASAEQRGISRGQFLDEHNDPSHYRPELPSSNECHLGEEPTDEYYGP